MKYLREFVIGSSFPVIALYYYNTYYNKYRTYDYFRYTLIAPIWFGLWNIISLLIATKYKLSKQMRFFIASILSLLSVFIIAQYFYTLTEEEWKQYYLIQLLGYMFVWNIIIYNIDKYI